MVHPQLGRDFIGLSFTRAPFIGGGGFGIEDAQVLVCPVEPGAGGTEVEGHAASNTVAAGRQRVVDSCARIVRSA